MTTDLSICNTALVLVGGEQITSFEDSSRAARLCSAIYSTTRDALLQKYPWGFTLEQVLLAKTNNTPLFDFKYEFQLPSNNLRVIKTDAANQDYRILQDKLFANVDPIEILHQIDPGEENYAAYFVRALELKMAELLSAALIQDETFSQLYERKFLFAIKEARSVDAQNSPNKLMSQNEFALTAVRGTDG